MTGIGFGRSSGRIGQKETNGDDDVAFVLQEGIDIDFVVRLLLRFEVFAFNVAIFGDSIGDAFVGCLVEGFVIDTTSVRHLAGLNLWSLRGGSGGGGRSTSGQNQRR